MNDCENFSYAAGMMDGDGCIQIVQKRSENKNYYVLRVSVTQVTEQVPLWLLRNFGGRIFKFCVSKSRRQPVYRWTLESVKAQNFLTNILPYLIEKSERAKLGIYFQSKIFYKGFGDRIPENVIEERLSLYHQMKSLNAKHSRKFWENQNINTLNKEV